MLSANLWVDMGLVNGTMGTIQAICYHEDSAPPAAVTVRFDNYSGTVVHGQRLPVSVFSLALPIKLAWAVTMHKAQGLTLDKVTVDIGKKEFSSGLTFVAISHVRKLTDIL